MGSGVELSVNELYAKLAQLTSARFEPVHAAARPGELHRIVVDPSKAGRELGWSRQIDLDDGLKQTVAWFRASS